MYLTVWYLTVVLPYAFEEKTVKALERSFKKLHLLLSYKIYLLGKG
jgi:hypothetical protein